jgi:hypothetical protein
MSDAATPANPAPPSGERRQVTTLFADMIGFTTISEQLGEEGTFALIQPIYDLMARAVLEQGGSVKDFTGDGIMALSGVPDALEDAPLRACRAALAIHERLALGSRDQCQAWHQGADAHRHQFRPSGGSANPRRKRPCDGAGRHGQSRCTAANPGRAGNGLSERGNTSPRARAGRDDVRRRARGQGQGQAAEGLSAGSDPPGRGAIRRCSRPRPQRLCRAGTRDGNA